MNIFTSIIFFLFCSVNLLAEIDLSKLKHPITPMLWKVEGKSLTKPSYLLGSIHLADPRVIRLHPLAEAAYKTADTLAVEISMDDENIKAMIRLWTRRDNQSLEQSIGTPLYKDLLLTYRKLGGLSPEYLFPNMKTWMAAMMLSSLTDSSDEENYMDAALLQRAKNDHKECWELETIHQSLSGFDNFTELEQIKLLEDTLSTIKYDQKNGINHVDSLLSLYLLGDKSNILKLTQELPKHYKLDRKLQHRVNTLLLDKRNLMMSKTIERRLTIHPYKSHFIIAGCLHFLGKNSLVQILQNHGYKITAINE